MLVFTELFLSTFVFVSQAPEATQKQAMCFQEVNLLDKYLMFTSWRRKVLGCVLELPAREDSYLFWHRFSGMRPCLAGIFSRFNSLGPTKTCSFVCTIHHSSRVFRFSFQASTGQILCVPNSLWTSWTSKGTFILLSTPLTFLLYLISHSPYPGPQRITSSLF